MNELVEFIRARLDEDRAWADNPECAEDPARLLREVEAKRRLIDEVWREIDSLELYYGDAADNMLKLLALPFADHPEFRKEWTVS